MESHFPMEAIPNGMNAVEFGEIITGQHCMEKSLQQENQNMIKNSCRDRKGRGEAFFKRKANRDLKDKTKLAEKMLRD